MSATNELQRRDNAIKDALELSPVAGGNSYQRYLELADPSHRVTEGDCDVTVETTSEFLNEISGTAHRKIWVPGDAAINFAGKSFRATNKVIASDKGIGGSKGALLYTTDKGINSPAYNGGGISGGFMHLDGASRLHGVRLRGASHAEHSNPAHPGYIEYRPPEGYNHYHARGINIHSSDVLIDNCEIYGWASAAIHIGSQSTHYSPTIEYNYIHDNFMTSAGYGVDITRGRPTVRFNYFNAHRHSIDGFGFHDSSFHVEGNVFGPSVSSHAIDMHGLHNNLSSKATNANTSSTMWHGQAGGKMVVKNNTFYFTNIIPDANYDTGKHTWCVSIRGVPSPRPNGEGIVIENNRIMHTGPQPRNYGVRSFAYPYAFNQQVSKSGDSGFSYPTRSDNFTPNYSIRDNQYNAPISKWEPRYGAPVNIENPVETAIGVPTNDPTKDREQRRRYLESLTRIRRDLEDITEAL